MKIGIFGGSFNPPHKMHKYIIDYLLKNYIDKVIVVPTGNKYTYKNNLVKDKYRYDMLKIIIKNNPNIEVSNYELKNHVVYTIDTLRYFKKKYKNDDIYFICGADNLDYIDTWKNGEEILKDYKIIVIGRDGYDIDKLKEKYKDYNIIISDIKSKKISSTKIREDLKNNKVNNYLDMEVFEYIRNHKLYGVGNGYEI